MTYNHKRMRKLQEDYIKTKRWSDSESDAAMKIIAEYDNILEKLKQDTGFAPPRQTLNLTTKQNVAEAVCLVLLLEMKIIQENE